MQNKKLLNTKEACEYLGISRSTFYKKTYSGMLSYYKPNNKTIYIEVEELDRYKRKNYYPSKEMLTQLNKK
jgi:excisionase family DNA binding protein